MRPTLMPRRGTASKGSVAGVSGSPSPSKAPTSSGQVPVSKFTACYRAVFTGSEKPPPYSEEDPERFYSDLFCLAVDKASLSELCEAVENKGLIESGTIKNNIRELFFYAVKCMKDSEADDFRLSNVVQSLQVVLRSFLARPLPNYSYDVINLLAGALDQGDIVFGDFVTGIDSILRNGECSVELRERTLSLALLVVASINQGSINSYFLRRDLFTTVTKLVSEPTTSHLAADGFLMLGILGNYHKYEARNPMLVRFEDLVDESIMKRVREAAATSLEQARNACVDIMDDTPTSFVSNVTSLMSTFKLLAGPLSPSLSRSTSNGAPLALPKESGFTTLPTEIIALLLPIYDLINSNKAFCSFLLHDRASSASPEPDFIATLISLSSYLGAHAASSRRSQLYSRLTYTILLLLVDEGAQVLIPTEHACSVRICRQRQPALAHSGDTKRPAVCSILDSIVQYLRFNIIRKRFDVDTYLLCFRMVHKIMHQLKTIRTRIEYDWQPLHQSILAVAQFLVSRQVELSDLDNMEELITQVLLTLDFAVIWADVILPDTEAIAQLYYEILRADVTITKLGTLITLANVPAVPPSPRLGPASPTIKRSSGSGSGTPKSPGLHATSSFSSLGPPEPSGPAAESVRNLGVVRSHFGEKVEDFREKNGSSVVEAFQVLAIIKSSMDGMDLRESMALEEVGMRRYSESEHEDFMSDMVRIVAKDVLKLTMPHA